MALAPRRRNRRRRIGNDNVGQGRQPEHYDGLEDELGDEPARGGDSPNEAVQETVGRLRGQAGAGENAAELTPSNRLEQVQQRAPEYAKEYRLTVLARLLLRKIPLDEIADQLGISLRQIRRDKKELYSRMASQAGELDLNQYVADSIMFYDEVRGATLRLASSTKNPLPARLAAYARSMQAEKDKTQVLDAAGVLDVLAFKAKEDQGNVELQELVSLAHSAINDDDLDINDELGLDSDEEELVDLLS